MSTRAQQRYGEHGARTVSDGNWIFSNGKYLFKGVKDRGGCFAIVTDTETPTLSASVRLRQFMQQCKLSIWNHA